jgi:hypothetical protein
MTTKKTTMIAEVTVFGDTFSQLESKALEQAAPLFRAFLDHGRWYVGDYATMLVIKSTGDSKKVGSHTWQSVIRVGIEDVATHDSKGHP